MPQFPKIRLHGPPKTKKPLDPLVKILLNIPSHLHPQSDPALETAPIAVTSPTKKNPYIIEIEQRIKIKNINMFIKF